VLADSYIVPQCLIAPRSLGALMALYEGNFLKLIAMAPGLRQPRSFTAGEAGRVSRSGRDLDLHLTVEGEARYTVDLRLTYLFPDPAGAVADPDLRLRLYRDAGMVEVLGWAGTHRHPWLQKLAREAGRELDRRWSRNMMLGKWLDYLGDMGHAF
jgi:hypothetical protein